MSEQAYTANDLLCEAGQVVEKSHQNWTFVDGAVPLPTYQMECPDCGHDQFIYSSVQVNMRRERSISKQFDANFKCQRCNHYITKTIPVKDEHVDMFERNFKGTSKANYSQLMDFFDRQRDEEN